MQDPNRLSQIATLWTLVRNAHEGPQEEVRAAQQKLVERYGGAVRRYLQGVVRDPELADELFQEFALALVKGELHGANPDRGKFRQFVKGVLFHLVADHHKKRKLAQLHSEMPEPAVSAASFSSLDRDFVRSWRDDLLARCWTALQAQETETGQLFWTVLRFRADHPDLSSQRMAEELAKQLDKPLTAAGVRQTLHRAREKFAELVLDEVIQSMETPNQEALEEELIELNLLEYCRPALERREGK